MAKKWIQKAVSRMKRKGTEGSFRRYCGGRVTMECIEKALKSPDKDIRAKARFAKAMLKLRKETGGQVNESTLDYISGLKSSFIDAMSDATLESFVTDIVRAFGKNEAYDRINTFAGELLKRDAVKKRQEGGPAGDAGTAAPPAPPTPAPAQQPPPISYEDYVAFVMSYPEHFRRLLEDIKAAEGQLAQQAAPAEQSAPAEQVAPQEAAMV